jgi:chromosome segregation ATPase
MTSNVFGQSKMMLDRISREKKRLHLLIASMQDQIAYLDEQEEEFKGEIKHLSLAEQHMHTTYSTLKTKQTAVDEMRRKVEAAYADPEMRSFLERQKKKRQSTGLYPPTKSSALPRPNNS